MNTVRKFVGPGPLALAAMGTYVVVLGLLVLGPWGWTLNRVTVRLHFFFRSDVPIAPGWLSPEVYGLALNVLLFVPLGVGVALLTGRSWWWVAVLAAVVSGTVEVAQGLWLPRGATLSDVVTNTAGALLGAGAVNLLARARGRRGTRSASARRP